MVKHLSSESMFNLSQIEFLPVDADKLKRAMQTESVCMACFNWQLHAGDAHHWCASTWPSHHDGDCGQFPHDSNLTIEIMLRVFHHLNVSICFPVKFTYQRKAYMHAPLYTGSFATSVVHSDGQHMQGQQK